MKKGFTLIELLIVVAIIAILAAIAIPNFLEAQTRAKVSRVKSDIRTIATAMETYYVDFQTYIPSYISMDATTPDWDNEWNMDQFLLTTPISYITTLPRDYFRKKAGLPEYYYIIAGKTAWGSSTTRLTGGGEAFSPKVVWTTFSFGPDVKGGYYANVQQDAYAYLFDHESKGTGTCARYDPTNGTLSFGDIIYWGGAMRTGANYWK